MKVQADILAELRKDIMLMEGFKPCVSSAADNGPLSLINFAFPNRTFPASAIHEFICNAPEEISASYGFITGIVSSLVKKTGIIAWVTANPVFPHALKPFGLSPEHVIFIQPPRQKDLLFVVEEVLKCDGLTAVIADIKEISFTESRRLQLSVEHSGVTGFLVRHKPGNAVTCSVTRWRISPILHDRLPELPGISFPSWNVELLKVRNGKPGAWKMQWSENTFSFIEQPVLSSEVPLRKVV